MGTRITALEGKRTVDGRLLVRGAREGNAKSYSEQRKRLLQRTRKVRVKLRCDAELQALVKSTRTAAFFAPLATKNGEHLLDVVSIPYLQRVDTDADPPRMEIYEHIELRRGEVEVLDVEAAYWLIAGKWGLAVDECDELGRPVSLSELGRAALDEARAKAEAKAKRAAKKKAKEKAETPPAEEAPATPPAEEDAAPPKPGGRKRKKKAD